MAGSRSIEEKPMSQRDDREVSLAEKRGHDASGSLRRSLHEALLTKIESGAARVGIIGLGYVGLPLARAFSDRGIAVLGFDVDPAKVARLQRGESYIGHIPDATIRQMREQPVRGHGRLSSGSTSPTSSSSASRLR